MAKHQWKSVGQMSFNYYFRKACDPTRPIWLRWSALHSCLIRAGSAKPNYAATRARWIDQWSIGPDNPPTDAHIFQALTELSVARNLRNEKRRAFTHKRVRAKMQGRRTLTRAERAEWQEINR